MTFPNVDADVEDGSGAGNPTRFAGPSKVVLPLILAFFDSTTAAPFELTFPSMVVPLRVTFAKPDALMASPESWIRPSVTVTTACSLALIDDSNAGRTSVTSQFPFALRSDVACTSVNVNFPLLQVKLECP